jgi:hypothetical protein
MIRKNINEYNTTAKKYNFLAVVNFQIIDFKVKSDGVILI